MSLFKAYIKLTGQDETIQHYCGIFSHCVAQNEVTKNASIMQKSH